MHDLKMQGYLDLKAHALIFGCGKRPYLGSFPKIERPDHSRSTPRLFSGNDAGEVLSRKYSEGPNGECYDNSRTSDLSKWKTHNAQANTMENLECLGSDPW
jgi:hypothetical protein